MAEIFQDMSWLQLTALCVSAVLCGINKTGIPGLGLLPVIILTAVFPAGRATGLQLVMLCMADLIAISYYRRCADWHLVFRLLPCTVAGLVLGAFVLRFCGDVGLRRGIGIILLALSALSFVRRKYWKPEKIPNSLPFVIGVGLAAGFTTLVANAAGPIMSLYLLAMRLPKEKYVGTAAWLFMIMNYIKLPVFIWQGRITADSFMAALPMIPLVIAGGVLGIVALKKLSLTLFERIIEILVVLSAFRMLF